MAEWLFKFVMATVVVTNDSSVQYKNSTGSRQGSLDSSVVCGVIPILYWLRQASSSLFIAYILQDLS